MSFFYTAKWYLIVDDLAENANWYLWRREKKMLFWIFKLAWLVLSNYLLILQRILRFDFRHVCCFGCHCHVWCSGRYASFSTFSPFFFTIKAIIILFYLHCDDGLEILRLRDEFDFSIKLNSCYGLCHMLCFVCWSYAVWENAFGSVNDKKYSYRNCLCCYFIGKTVNGFIPAVVIHENFFVSDLVVSTDPYFI